MKNDYHDYYEQINAIKAQLTNQEISIEKAVRALYAIVIAAEKRDSDDEKELYNEVSKAMWDKLRQMIETTRKYQKISSEYQVHLLLKDIGISLDVGAISQMLKGQ